MIPSPDNSLFGREEAGSLPGLGGVHGLNQWSSGNGHAFGFLLSNQTQENLM